MDLRHYYCGSPKYQGSLYTVYHTLKPFSSLATGYINKGKMEEVVSIWPSICMSYSRSVLCEDGKLHLDPRLRTFSPSSKQLAASVTSQDMIARNHASLSGWDLLTRSWRSPCQPQLLAVTLQADIQPMTLVVVHMPTRQHSPRERERVRNIIQLKINKKNVRIRSSRFPVPVQDPQTQTSQKTLPIQSFHTSQIPPVPQPIQQGEVFKL